MALFLKKILGAFWRFPAQNVALPNSKQLDTLENSIQKGWYDSEQDPSFDSNDFDEINDIFDNSDGGDEEENGNWKKKCFCHFLRK